MHIGPLPRLVIAAFLGLTDVAQAQTALPAASASPGWTTLPAGTAAPHPSLTLPMFGDDEYSYNPLAPSQPTKAPNRWSDAPLDQVLAQTHGFVSAGVGTGGGRALAAGVTIPLIPGKLDLSVAGQTGQTRGLTGFTPTGPQIGIVSYNQYNVALAYHPTEDFAAIIAISGARIGPR